MAKKKAAAKPEKNVLRIGKGDMIRLLSSSASAERTGLKLTYTDATLAIDAVFDAVKTLLDEHGKVNIPGFGTFLITETSAREARNPQNGKTVKVPAKFRPKFRASTKLSDSFNGKK